MRKTLIAIAALGLFTFVSCKEKEANLNQKWEAVPDEDKKKQNDSLYQVYVSFLDTMTTFPKEFVDAKARFDKMPADSIAMLDPNDVELMRISDFKVFKDRLKANAEEEKRLSDSLDASVHLIFDFQKSGVLKKYVSNNVEMVDTGTSFKADIKAKKIYLFANPSMAKKEDMGDTVIFDIKHIAGDSLSIAIDPKSKNIQSPVLKPMNFKVYKEEVKKEDKK